ELDHLPFGSAGFERGEEDSYRDRGRGHGGDLSKRSATPLQKMPVVLPSESRRGRSKWNRGCGEWNCVSRRAADVLLVPPIEDDELPEPPGVIASPGEVLLDELPH